MPHKSPIALFTIRYWLKSVLPIYAAKLPHSVIQRAQDFFPVYFLFLYVFIGYFVLFFRSFILERNKWNPCLPTKQ